MSGEDARQAATEALITAIECVENPVEDASIAAAAVDAITDHVLDVLQAQRGAEQQLHRSARLKERIFVAAIASGKTPGQALAVASEALELIGAQVEV